MRKAERPSNYFSNSHTESGWEDKERSNSCPNFVRNTPKLNTEESIFKDEKLHLYTCIGHSKVVEYCTC